MNERPKYITLRYPWNIVLKGYMLVGWADGREDRYEFDEGMTDAEVDAAIAEMFPGVEPEILC